MDFWHRVEPNTIDTDVEEGIEARIADPLWMLARQWQLGEFTGEDAASPIHVRAKGVSSSIESFRNDARPNTPVERFVSTQPLECRVEAEDVIDGPGAVALAAEAGIQFLRRLDLAGFGEQRRSVDWRSAYGFDHASDGVDVTYLPEPTQRRLALLERRGLDGRKLFATTKAQLKSLISPANWAAVSAVYRAWKAEYSDRFREPGQSGDCWLDERLEYRFSLGARTVDGELVLASDEYHGGHLDWYAFRVASEDTHGLGRDSGIQQELDLLPQPAMFRGQGVPRWWEFEDRSVYFGNLSAGPADTARLVVAEYGTVFSDDWFIVPLTVRIGSVTRIVAIDVVDVFGGFTRIRATAVEDEEIYGSDRPFRYFELEGDDSATRGFAPWLFVPPALADSLGGRPVEDVTLVRDENANLGWAIEQAVELPTGESMPRRRQWARIPDLEQGDAVANGDQDYEVWRYTLQTPVPPWWVPLMPESSSDAEGTRLRRARLQSWQEMDDALVGAKGRLIGVAKALRLFEEEVPRGGVQITRAWQRARASDGRVHVWMARRKRPGRGDRGSGLKFDTLDR